jgi:hypothetical protein
MWQEFRELRAALVTMASGGPTVALSPALSATSTFPTQIAAQQQAREQQHALIQQQIKAQQHQDAVMQVCAALHCAALCAPPCPVLCCAVLC